MFKKSYLIYAAGLGSVLLAVATLPAGAQQGGIKIAVIDNDRVFQESNPGKAASEQLQGAFTEWQGKIDKAQQQLDDLNASRQQQRTTLNAAALKKLDDQIAEKQIEAQRIKDDAQREFTRLRQQVVAGMEDKLAPMIERLATEQGYTVMFNTQTPGLLHFDKSVDATDQLIALVNESG
ncbi:MAG: OmpH family outer membrane protein [Acidobacteriota bacterium]